MKGMPSVKSAALCFLLYILSLVQEQGKEDAPYTLVLLGGVDGLFPLEGFEPTPEGLELAKITGDIVLRALAVGHDNRSG
jgi:hypothetical protein